jgi:hypothetical protein
MIEYLPLITVSGYMIYVVISEFIDEISKA